MRVAFLGLGLIGGSIARALRADGPDWWLSSWTPGGAGPRAALAAGVLHAAPPTLAATVAGTDIVLLAAPPTACLRLLDEIGGPLRGALAAGAVVSDVASTKAAVVARAAALGLPFVGGHPMAGREAAGFDAADAGLFRGRPWVIVAGPGTPAALVDRVERLAGACGAVPVRMGADDHDAAVGGISHLPLLAAAALVEAVAGGPGEPDLPGWDQAAALAASGWAGATRLARGDPAMGAGIAVTNAGPLAARLRTFRDRLGEWLALLEVADGAGAPDEDVIRARLAAARDRLQGDR
ncbi:MAG: prephenate dehydrogenase/arogenate dehydrogenase family protein [Chloroflexi bacterium]|nr:prephenate dehydrogenase/arogenate dehydrogenase family protein [Chloroflexota bacterium]